MVLANRQVRLNWEPGPFTGGGAQLQLFQYFDYDGAIFDKMSISMGLGWASTEWVDTLLALLGIETMAISVIMGIPPSRLVASWAGCTYHLCLLLTHACS